MYDYDRRRTYVSAADADLFDLALVGHWILFALRAPLRHRWVAGISFLAILSSAIAGILLFPKRYEVTTTLLAGSPLSGALGADREGHRDAPTRAARELVLQRDNLSALAQEIQFAERYLAERPPLIRAVHAVTDLFTGKERNVETVTDSLIETLEERLWISVNTEDTVTITFRWWDKQIAFDMVDAAAQSFLEMRHAAEIKTVSESISILEEHKGRLVAQIDERLEVMEARDARERADAKDRKGPAVVVPRSVAREDPELTRLQGRLLSSRRAAADLEAARQQRALELQAELLRQQSIYAVDHPTIAATKRMIEALQRPSAQVNELNAEVRELEAAVLERTGAGRKGSSAVARADTTPAASFLFELDPREEFERAQLRHLRSQLEDINDRIVSSSLRMETAEAAFKHRYSVVTPPRMPKGPVKPYTMFFGISGLFGGLLFAILAAVLMDLWRGKVVERWQLERHFNLPLLGDAQQPR